MSNSGGLRYDHPSKVAKVPLKISSELKSKGRKDIDEVGGDTLTDLSIADAQILGAGTLPASYINPFTVAQQQGGEGSCVPHACDYAIGSKYYIFKGHTSFSNSINIFSPEYVYNQTKFGADCSSGTSIQVCLDLLASQGVCLMATMPYSSVNGCSTLPNTVQRAEAANYRITGYTRTLARDRSAIKTLLATGSLVIFSWWPDNNLVSGNGNIPAPYVWSGPRNGAGIPHGSVIVGYDDNKVCPDGTVGAYKILNSWGSTWEDSGCIWVGYQWFEIPNGDTIAGAGVGTYAYTINGIVSATGNVVPIANAGADQTITLPTSSVNLSGSATDPDGSVVSVLWTQVSGPNTASMSGSTSLSASVAGLIQGTYIFQFQVTDNLGATNAASTKVIVNPASPPVNLPPIAKAGNDLTVTQPTSTVTVNGSGSTDGDGTISSYSWAQLSGPNTASMGTPLSAVNFISNLTVGTYQFGLTVTDNLGATATDVVIVNVNQAVPNQPPVANAGFNRTVPSGTSTTLDGSSSYDPDGSITSYLWERVSGPANPSISQSTSVVANITPTVAGDYVYKLTVTDSNSLTAVAYVTITVTAVSTESVTLSVTKSTQKGKTTDTLSWIISLEDQALSAELQLSTIQGDTAFATFWPVQPFVAKGSYPYASGIKKIRYYRVKVRKADGSLIYSNIYSIR